MRRTLAIAQTVLLLAWSGKALAADIPIEVFAQIPGIATAKMSPDGTAMAYFRPHEGQTYLAIEELGEDGKVVLIPPIDDMGFLWVHWANNDRLVIATQFADRRQFLDTNETRLLGVSRNGGKIKKLVRSSKRKEIGSHIPVNLPPPPEQDKVVDWLPDDPDHILVAMDADHNRRWEVRRINVRNGRYKTIDPGPHGAQEYLTDDSGRLRFGHGYRGDVRTAWFRPSGGEWTNVSEAEWFDAGFVPLKFQATGNVAYVAGPNEEGRVCIRLLNLVTGEFVETVFEHESVDVDTLLLAPVTEKPVGVRYTVDLPHDEYFSTELAMLQRSVDKVLPDAWNDIRSASLDLQQVIIYSSSAIDPGAYYHWDRETDSFNFLGQAMPDLPTEAIAPKKPVSYTARDGTMIPAYLTVPSPTPEGHFPTVVLPHGGPKVRDDIRFSYLVQFLASRGYAVLQPNFRGSTGYGRPYMEAGIRQWGGRMQDDVTDGAKWLIEQGIADPERTCIVGWSYGGYSAMMGAIKTPELFTCAASINGVMDLARLREQDKTELVGGEVWVNHMGLDGQSVRDVSPLHQAESIQIPVLIVQAKDDHRVPDEHGRTMADRLRKLDKDVDYLEIEHGGHSLTTSTARAEMLKGLEEFLARHLE